MLSQPPDDLLVGRRCPEYPGGGPCCGPFGYAAAGGGGGGGEGKPWAGGDENPDGGGGNPDSGGGGGAGNPDSGGGAGNPVDGGDGNPAGGGGGAWYPGGGYSPSRPGPSPPVPPPNVRRRRCRIAGTPLLPGHKSPHHCALLASPVGRIPSRPARYIHDGGNFTGSVRWSGAVLRDRPFPRPDMSQVAMQRASVPGRCRPLTLAVGCCCQLRLEERMSPPYRGWPASGPGRLPPGLVSDRSTRRDSGGQA